MLTAARKRVPLEITSRADSATVVKFTYTLHQSNYTYRIPTERSVRISLVSGIVLE